MIQYTKAFGVAEAVRLINIYMDQQESIYKNVLERINERERN